MILYLFCEMGRYRQKNLYQTFDNVRQSLHPLTQCKRAALGV